MKDIYTYKGINIYRNLKIGFALRWIARLDNGQQLAADTLKGMKRLINTVK